MDESLKEQVKAMTGIPLWNQIKHRLRAAFGERLKGVVLYGSEARGEKTEDSDVDLLVLLDGPVSLLRDLETIVHALYPLQLQIFRPIHAVPVNADAYEAGEFGLYRNAKKEGVML